MPNIFMSNLRSIKNKFDDLCCQLYLLNAEVVICTETWLTSSVPSEAYNIIGFDCFRTDRKNDSGHGGVALWSRKCFNARKMLFPVYDFCEVCTIQIPCLKLLVVAMYLPPGIPSLSFKSFCNSFVNVIDDFLNRLPCHRLIVAGDFNQYDRTFLSSKFSLRNIVTSATRLNANLDLIFVDERLCTSYESGNVIIGPPIGSSDHNVVFAKTHSPSKTRVFEKHILFDLRESHVLAFEKKFLSNDFCAFYSCTDINDICNMFYDFIYDALSVIPQKTVYITNSDAPWMTPLIKSLIDRRWNAYRSRNWVLYNSLKFKAKNEIWQAKKRFFCKKAKTVKGLWSYVSMERGARKGNSGSLFNGPGKKLDDVINALNDHFSSVMNLSTTYPDSFDLPADDSWFPSFGVENVWDSLHNLPLKATGSDDIPTKLYKMSAVILAEPLHHLFVHCFRSRAFPSQWKIADITPVPKSTGSTVEDYRPISLLPVPAKLAEKLILKDMRSTLTGLLGVSQFGIRKNSSTTHAVIATHDYMTQHADDPDVGASIFIAFDFSKAFDKIDHCELIRRAVEVSLPAGFIHLLNDYLSHRKQRVRVNGHKSVLKCVTSGVPQGSLLGPFLFGMYISFLEPLYMSTHMIKYVDDVSLVAPVRKNHVQYDLVKVKSEIDHLSRWSSAHHLTLNVTKTTGLIFSRGRFKVNFCIESFLDNVRFQQSVRFLGIVLHESLGWGAHVNFIEKKCSQRMYILRRLRSVTSKDEFLLIYYCLVRSLLEYACPVFVGLSSTDALRLQRIQNRCLRIKQGVEAHDLTVRRRSMALSTFFRLPGVNTLLKDLYPASLPSGRFSVPFCRTSLRRSSFIPYMCIVASSVHCD